jgi:hypothetical protein
MLGDLEERLSEHRVCRPNINETVLHDVKRMHAGKVEPWNFRPEDDFRTARFPAHQRHWIS